MTFHSDDTPSADEALAPAGVTTMSSALAASTTASACSLCGPPAGTAELTAPLLPSLLSEAKRDARLRSVVVVLSEFSRACESVCSNTLSDCDAAAPAGINWSCDI